MQKGNFSKPLIITKHVNMDSGTTFQLKFILAIQKIVDYPEVWPVLKDAIRRCLTNRFPYGILYSIERKEIFILAVMHLHREPEYWKYRYKR